MKRALLCILFCAAPAFAAQIATDNLVTLPPSAPQILIPAAGTTAGAQGTFFRTDINVINYASHDQRVAFSWLPQGATGVGISARVMTIPARTGIQSDDFVTAVMQQSGLGAILINGLAADNSIDASAQLYATARIWTNQPGSNPVGTTSQTFSTIIPTVLTTGQLSILGVKRNDQYRLNIGVVNLDQTTSQTYQITVAGTNGTTTPETVFVTVPPFSMSQVPVVGPVLVNPQVLVANISTPVRSNVWAAYASSVDNVTGDSWSEQGFQAPPVATTSVP